MSHDKMQSFFSSYDAELFSTMKRLDDLIGKDHWLTVGTYKETLLRSLISKSIPRKFTVSNGFILAMTDNKEIIRSKQIDIIVWDSTNYAPIFVDGDFVICPPEACRAVIEVKSTLGKKELRESLYNLDSLCPFFNTKYMISHGVRIRKYIFAYKKSYSLKFPHGIFQVINEEYKKDNKIISAKDRLTVLNSSNIDDGFWSLSGVDAIFLLNEGAVLRTVRGANLKRMMQFSSYNTTNPVNDHTYAFFEYDLQSYLGSIDNKQGLWYASQPGLYSLKKALDVEKRKPDDEMSFPSFE